MNDEVQPQPRFAPEVEGLLAMFNQMPSEPLSTEMIGFMRQQMAQWGDKQVAPGVTVRDVSANDVDVRLYYPEAAGPLPLHLYLHGGGFMLGSALSDTSNGPLSRRAVAAGVVVASVEYRLAPEHKFPAGIEDSYAALAGLVAQAAELGIDPGIISVGGASSGGNFAAVLALMARDRGGPKLALQLLEVAGTDLTKSSYAWRHPQPGHDTTRESDLAMIDFYLPDLAMRGNPYASPVFAADLRGLAPAYAMSAEFDPRRDECEAYVVRLRDAGVPAVARTMLGHVHGSAQLLLDWPPARAWEAEASNAIAVANNAAQNGEVPDFGAIAKAG
jgi:acetyl esterase